MRDKPCRYLIEEISGGVCSKSSGVKINEVEGKLEVQGQGPAKQRPEDPCKGFGFYAK